MERYILQKSEKKEWWVCTDTEFGIVLRWREHHLNDEQEATVLDDEPKHSAQEYARAAREMGDWLKRNHYNLIF